MPTPSKFVWYELMTTDDSAAQHFYAKVVGWRPQDAGQPGMKYTLLMAGEAPVAGLVTLPKDIPHAGARPGWIGYVGVDDVDGCVQHIAKAGGKIHTPPTDIPGIGRFARVADPCGAAFSIFKGAGPMDQPPADAEKPGLVGWHELFALDSDRAFDFYAEMFGWTRAEAIDMGAMGRYQLFATGDAPTGGMMTKPANLPTPSWNYYFQVDTIGNAMERSKMGGGRVINGPMQVPGGSWIVQGVDPQGAMFSLVSAKA